MWLIPPAFFNRFLLHIPVGLVNVICCYASALLGGLFFVAFIVYELNEDMHLKDNAYQDIQGFMAGIFVGALAWILLV